jgi:hypothetical protein
MIAARYSVLPHDRCRRPHALSSLVCVSESLRGRVVHSGVGWEAWMGSPLTDAVIVRYWFRACACTRFNAVRQV